VVFGLASGYIDDNDKGIDPKMPVITLSKGDDGIWVSTPVPSFAKKYEGRYYMYRIANALGQTTYKTDIFSRGLVGRGSIDPSAGPWDGTIATLDGTVSCSIITDPDTISSEFPLPEDRQPVLQNAADFWKDEFTEGKPIPTNIDDMVIYELHVGALGNTPGIAGTLQDAVNLLDYLVDLGINAIELLPMSEFFGSVGWGYGDTHHMVIQSSAGGRDEYRYFIRECHKQGIAVIQDVVYNHYGQESQRAEWAYDSDLPEQNIYNYYIGNATDYGSPDGGYLDNDSTSFAPNYRETVVRQQFISAAVFLIDEMHIDGLRVDLTQAIHEFNVLHANGAPVPEANEFGCKFLREWGRTLRMLYPNVMLMAEDYSGWLTVTESPATGGFGFDAVWYADFFHALIGYQGGSQLLLEAGFGDGRPLDMAGFSANLYQSQFNHVVFHINHDNAGANITNRTVVTAVNQAALTGSTRSYAEARSRVVAGLSILSAGTPLFFMGEEIAAQKPYRYNDFIDNREDLQGDRLGIGARMYLYYQQLLALNKQYESIRSKNIDILCADNTSRVIIFKRWAGTEQVLIAASLNNEDFPAYMVITDAYRLPDGGWEEVFNSDAAEYGGSNTGNSGAVLPAQNGSMTMVIPANGLVVFVKVN